MLIHASDGYKKVPEPPGRPGLFYGLEERALEEVIRNSTLQHYKADRVLVQQGDNPSYVYFIIEGRIRTLRTNPDGNEVSIRLLEPGETCMDAVIFMGVPSPIVAQVTANSLLMLIPQEFVKKYAFGNKQFANNLLRIVAYHYKSAIYQIDAMAIKTPVQRVGYYFLRKHLDQREDKSILDIPFKKSTIASHLGMTPETFSRALAQLRMLGVQISGEKIQLKDTHALCHFCDVDAAAICSEADGFECPHHHPRLKQAKG